MRLPEKRFFTLDEMVRRWASYQVDRATLLDYARRDRLTFAAYLPEVGNHRTVTETEAYKETKEVTTLLQLGKQDARNIRFPVWYLTGEDAVRVLSARGAQQVAVQKFYRTHERTRESSVFRASPRFLVPDDIVVTRSERDRFERKHKLDTSVETSEAALQRVRNIARRFPEAVHALQTRYAARKKIVDMADEYDIQDFMGALLAIDFKDVRSEDYTPSVAGRRTRIDFVLAREGIGVELKMTREGLADKGVGDELTQDIERYRAHPLCRTLVCVVYDPGRFIQNNAALEALTGDRIGCKVEVLVVR